MVKSGTVGKKKKKKALCKWLQTARFPRQRKQRDVCCSSMWKNLEKKKKSWLLRSPASRKSTKCFLMTTHRKSADWFHTRCYIPEEVKIHEKPEVWQGDTGEEFQKNSIYLQVCLISGHQLDVKQMAFFSNNLLFTQKPRKVLTLKGINNNIIYLFLICIYFGMSQSPLRATAPAEEHHRRDLLELRRFQHA